MTRRRGGGLTALLLALANAGPLAGQGLDVPFVPQGELLCGGASAAMVLRWHGLRGVHPGDFAHLVRPEEGGIRTVDLAESFRTRGWTVRAGAGDTAALTAALAAKRPPIVLLGAGEIRYHYVTVVGLEGDTVWVHDPASGPRVPLGREAFERRWEASGRWTLLAEPPPPPAPGTAPSASEGAPTRETASQEAPAGAKATGSHPFLLRASERFRAEDWDGAALWAERAASTPGAGEDAWRLLAVSRYLGGHPGEALAAWERAGGLELDLVRVEGLRRTRTTLVHRLAGLNPGAPLTADALSRARRRVELLPASSASRVTWRPVDGTRAEVEVAVVEPPLLPRSLPALAVTAARGLVRREASLTVSSALGIGEALTVEGRWSAAAPRLAATVSVPAVPGLPGVTRVSLERRSERYADGGVEGVTRGALGLEDWLGGSVGWWSELGFDEWRDGRSGVSGEAGLHWRPPPDRLDLTGRVLLGWRGQGEGFAATSLDAAWRSTAGSEGWGVSARAGLAHVSAGTPRPLWPGAGTGTVRPWLLRAHPLVDGDAVAGPAWGRTLASAGTELVRWTSPAPSRWTQGSASA